MSVFLETGSIYLCKKRKLKTELLGPLRKHVRCLEHKSSPDSSVNVDIRIFATGNESDPESANDSNSFQVAEDAYMPEQDEDKTSVEYAKACSSDEPSTSTSSWGGVTSRIDPYSLDSRSLTSDCSKSESASVSGGGRGYAFLPSLNFDDDCCRSEYKSDDAECYTEKELENLLFSGGLAAPSDYVLSSGRWSVIQGNINKLIFVLNFLLRSHKYLHLEFIWLQILNKLPRN